MELPTMPGLYIHIPFCRRKCRYCSFFSVEGGEGLFSPLVEALILELGRRGEISSPFDTVYVGGGTPTVVPVELLVRLLDAVAPRLAPGAEVTLECNPESAEGAALKELRRAGVNRLSVGAQVFDEKLLAFLGRGHSPDDVRRTVDAALSAGFDNIGLDLIYAIPGQTLSVWQSTLQAALALSPAHLSAYALSYDDHTPLYRDRLAGRVRPLDEDADRAMYDLAIDMLAPAGLGQYEVSNFARAGFRCRHNLNFWQGEDYVGIGPTAAGRVGLVHRRNIADVQGYIARITAGQSPVEETLHLTPLQRAGELAMLALRTVEGLDMERFARQTEFDARALFAGAIRRYGQEGLLVEDRGRLALTREGMAVADGILAEFLF